MVTWVPALAGMTGYILGSYVPFAIMRIAECKRAKPTVDFLVKHDVPAWRAWLLALSGKGWWRRSGSPQAHEAMTIAWFEKQRLVNLSAHYAKLQSAGNRRVR